MGLSKTDGYNEEINTHVQLKDKHFNVYNIRNNDSRNQY